MEVSILHWLSLSINIQSGMKSIHGRWIISSNVFHPRHPHQWQITLQIKEIVECLLTRSIRRTNIAPRLVSFCFVLQLIWRYICFSVRLLASLVLSLWSAVFSVSMVITSINVDVFVSSSTNNRWKSNRIAILTPGSANNRPSTRTRRRISFNRHRSDRRRWRIELGRDWDWPWWTRKFFIGSNNCLILHDLILIGLVFSHLQCRFSVNLSIEWRSVCSVRFAFLSPNLDHLLLFSSKYLSWIYP